MSRIGYTLSYLIWLTGQIIAGSIAVTRIAFGPPGQVAPSIIELPLRCRTDLEIIAFASSITITPGTLVVGTAHGGSGLRPTLFVHVLQTSTRAEAVEGLREMEDRLLRASRGRRGADALPHIHQQQQGTGRTYTGEITSVAHLLDEDDLRAVTGEHAPTPDQPGAGDAGPGSRNSAEGPDEPGDTTTKGRR